MSDTSQGPGWWQASDGKWYPPSSAPSYAPPYAPPYAVPVYPAKTNGLAVASMVLGILICTYGITSILAIIFGFVAKKQIRESPVPLSGSGMATAGIVLGFVGVGLWILYVGSWVLFWSIGDSGSSY